MTALSLWFIETSLVELPFWSRWKLYLVPWVLKSPLEIMSFQGADFEPSFVIASTELSAEGSHKMFLDLRSLYF